MSTEFTLITAFLAGLAGSIHCVGMCGGIVGALTMGLPESVRGKYLRLLPYLLTYNVGRIFSYMLAGGLMGFLGAQFSNLLPMNNPHVISAWISGTFMIALGLYIGSWWQALTILEKSGAHLWKKIEPIGRRFIPVKNPTQALGLGVIWGWLPCGLVYSILPLALASADPLQGSALLLAFGVGTLPMLFMLGATAQIFTQFTRKLIVRRVAGACILVFGVFMLFGTHDHSGHGGHAGHGDHSGHVMTDANASTPASDSTEAMDHHHHH